MNKTILLTFIFFFKLNVSNDIMGFVLNLSGKNAIHDMALLFFSFIAVSIFVRY